MRVHSDPASDAILCFYIHPRFQDSHEYDRGSEATLCLCIHHCSNIPISPIADRTLQPPRARRILRIPPSHHPLRVHIDDHLNGAGFAEGGCFVLPAGELEGGAHLDAGGV